MGECLGPPCLGWGERGRGKGRTGRGEARQARQNQSRSRARGLLFWLAKFFCPFSIFFSSASLWRRGQVGTWMVSLAARVGTACTSAQVSQHTWGTRTVLGPGRLVTRAGGLLVLTLSPHICTNISRPRIEDGVSELGTILIQAWLPPEMPCTVHSGIPSSTPESPVNSGSVVV